MLHRGERFGRLEIVEPAEEKRKYICRCECGKITVVHESNLKSLHTKSCGCLKGEIVASGAHTTHGYSNTRLYKIWKYMRKRCNNPNDSNYGKYGGRGISVCSEWQENFESFRDWAISNGYKDGLSLDRIDNDGNYEPGNCRWANAKEQANNRRSSRRLKFDGKDMTISEWADETGISQAVLEARLRLGWSVEEILTRPLRTAEGSKVIFE